MRAVRVVRHGEPSAAIEVRDDVEVPEPGPGQVRVAVSAASLNFGDIARCRGGVAAVMAQPPFTLGMDVGGVGRGRRRGRRGVARSPGRRHRAAVARRPGRARPGRQRSSTRRPSSTTPRPPRSRCPSTSATSPSTSAPRSRPARPSSSAAAPARSVRRPSSSPSPPAPACSRSPAAPDKAQLCRDLGAEVAIDHTSEDVFDAVMDATGDRGAEVIFDPIGGEQTETMWTCGALGGRYLAGRLQRRPGVRAHRPPAAQAVDGQHVGRSACCSPTSTCPATSAASASTRSRPRRAAGARRAARARRRGQHPAGRSGAASASTTSRPRSRTTPPVVRRAAPSST